MRKKKQAPVFPEITPTTERNQSEEREDLRWKIQSGVRFYPGSIGDTTGFRSAWLPFPIFVRIAQNLIGIWL